jgi:hypothetical protein
MTANLRGNQGVADRHGLPPPTLISGGVLAYFGSGGRTVPLAFSA